MHSVNLDFDKILIQRGGRQVHLMATVFNVLQDEAWQTYFTTNFFSPTFAKPSTWAPTRYVNIATRVQF